MAREPSTSPTWDTILAQLDHRLASIEAKQAVDSARLQTLNDWHFVVTGALWAMGSLGGATFVVSLVLLKTLLEKL